MRRVTVALSALALTLPLPAAAGAAETSGSAPAPGDVAAQTVTVVAAADSHVSSRAPSTNYGRSATLEVDADASRVSYLQFDLSPYAGRTVTRATLGLRATLSGSAGSQNVKLVTNDSWTETGLTHNNKPAVTSTVLGVLSRTAVNTSYSVPLSSTVVNGQVGGKLSLAMDSTSTDGLDAASRETGSSAPRLVLQLAAADGTTAPADTVPPTISAAAPAAGASDVAPTTAVTATFSEAMSAQTIAPSTVLLTDAAGAPVPSAVSFDPASRTVSLRPTTALSSSVRYTATVRGGATGVKDAAGNPLSADRVWTFTTAAGTSVTSPPPVTSPVSLPTGQVTASVETAALAGATGDVADDPAIYVDASDPSRSVVIGTNKSSTGGGLAVYDLSGRLLQFRADGKFNNVDLRAGMSLAGKPTVIVTASNRSTNTLAFYRYNTTARSLEPINARSVSTGFEPYGLCMYKSARTGTLSVFVTQNDGGTTDQYELMDNGGRVDARKVRSLAVGSLSEGCVADDELGHLYIGEEDKAIWKYGAEASSGSTRKAIGTVGDGHLVADVEGMAIATRPGGGGHLIVSSQGDSSYAVYERSTGTWVRSFKVAGAGAVDGTSLTDGLDVVSAGVGSAFPRGLMVVHDAANGGGTSSNYKFIDLGQVLGS